MHGIIINNSPSKTNENYGVTPQRFYSSTSPQNELKIIPLILVAQELFFFQSLRSFFGFYKVNPLWQFNIVGEAKTQPEAIKVAVQQQPALILLDIDFHQEPEEAINTIVELNSLFNKRNQEKLKIIAISSQRDEKVIFLAMQAGALGYVLKENWPSQLCSAMLTVLSGQVYLCPEVATQFFRGFHLYGQASFTNANQSRSLVTSSDSHHPYRLTQREQEVLELLVKGYCNEEIAKPLYITIATVKAHLTSIFEKLGVKNRSQAIVRALELDIV
ncbi:LuxR C-terminal-related transcriptional regulator [Microcoleus sp. OTE_8_concoct_300]|uniref:LuxR C-terminal-related transcriptional regulator n=1 Tax=Microcoleus sp. OTE_8_concoct_300 TaxID=2964710 RepID=UPI00403F448E